MWKTAPLSASLALLLALAPVACGGSDDSGRETEVPSAPDFADAAEVGDSAPADTNEPDPADASDAAAPWWEALDPVGPTLRELLGVSTHMKQSAGDDWRRDVEMARYSSLGGIRIREDYHWHKIEPVDDEWHFEVVETQVALAREHGTPIDAMLAYAVDWATPDGTTSGIDPAEYAEFAGAVAGRFCADIRSYELWNEPNLDRFWKPTPDPVAYGALLVAASATIRQACPEAQVLTAGFSAWDGYGLAERWLYLDELHEAYPDLCDHFDVLAIHPYTFGQFHSPEHDAVVVEDVFVKAGQTAMTESARERLAAWGCPDRPIWFTEMGWPSYDLDEATQGRYLARSVLLAARDRVEAYFWYTFWDGEPITDGIRPHENYFGLFGWPGGDPAERPKPAWYALEAMVARLGSARLAADLSPRFGLPEDVYLLAFTDESGVPTLAMWDGRDEPDEPPARPLAPDTRYRLTLPLPGADVAWRLHDIEGAEIDAGTGATVDLELTPSVRYLVLEP